MIIDAHAHCGIYHRFPPQAFEDYLANIRGSPIEGAVMFSPVMEIYDRNDPDFVDDKAWRKRRKSSNLYLLGLENREIDVFPFFFIWNDFAVDQLDPRHCGIKWHRHADEPMYNYDDPACTRAVEEIRRRGLPVVFEEELENTVRFVNEIAAGVNVIIPHLGMLNGGYRAIEKNGLWENPRVWTDTSLASPAEIRDYIDSYGSGRIMFGSDFPFGAPKSELSKVMDLPVSETVREAITAGNIRRLIQK
ncbi:MAG: amidohydrolase [Desulfobacteraceae bacterium]|nr:amidohydrolase [Desulfobacteraceae bacterium]